MQISKLAAASLTASFLALTAAGAGATAISASAATGDATVTVVHGIPNTPVDVYANGKKILSGFTFKTVACPLQLPAGSYAIAVRKAGSAVTSTPVLSATEQVTAGRTRRSWRLDGVGHARPDRVRQRRKRGRDG